MAKHSIDQYAEILIKAGETVEKKDISLLLDLYLDYLRRDGATHLLPRILARFEEMEKNGGAIPVAITTAHETEEKDLKKIAQLLGEKVVHTESHDPAIIGGFIAQSETLRVDASLASTIARFHSSLLS